MDSGGRGGVPTAPTASDPDDELSPPLPTQARALPSGPRVAQALRSLEEAAGGRAALTQVLLQSTDPRLDYVVGLLADPRNDVVALEDLCRQGRVKLSEVLAAFKDGVYARMYLQVMTQIAAETPEIVQDVLRRAQPHQAACPTCLGRQTVIKYDATGTSLGEVTCDRCRGVGTLPAEGDLDRQKLALDLAQLLPKKGGTTVAIDQRQQAVVKVGDASPAGYAKLLEGIDAILHKGKAQALPLDAEILDAAPPDAADVPTP